MNQKYDAIVLGTGLTECVMSGLLSVHGKRVLHLDRNKYYGGESASLNLEQLYEKFKPELLKTDEEGNNVLPQDLGRSRDYCVDLIPKLLMANGKLVKLLHLTGVTRYQMDFAKIEGSYVYKKGKIHKVPATPAEVAKSPLMGFFEKLRCKKLVSYVHSYDETDPKTHKGYDLTTMTCGELFKKYGISNETEEFLGHSVALHTSDKYLERPALETVKKLNLYANSLAMYGGSPYIYPLYGLGELPQVFARLCAVYGGTYMLDRGVDKVLYDENGKVTGIESNGEKAECDMIVGDPSYFPEKVRKTGQVIRAICIMDHPIEGTSDAQSCQIIIPQEQAKRQNDIYICCTSYNHRTCPKGKYIAIIATTVETSNPEKEIQIGLDLVGSTLEKFVYILDTFEPKQDGKEDNVYISRSYDPTTHFETCAGDIVDIYERLSGEKFDWSKKLAQQSQE
uniref:Rab GDP dissociation inhibitor n=1 Tax=Percolomonas cosmopolitus TaxID=63605 RepID=A0A7S1KQV9_9EUKA|eukprot:CAMPEP_0117443000 /NCGR_PEP_ID=MMETSP0759-20121206/4457_1 /TAXON_ID=63605 /ORGANISM="Percolomonas cosmopolitus, Strain WS" /LENGTH=451 /DNA_ID=CAMNT_0005234937 /DNA_START=309 /DNA_END=1664 /DNA_ORIENTATION=-